MKIVILKYSLILLSLASCFFATKRKLVLNKCFHLNDG